MKLLKYITSTLFAILAALTLYALVEANSDKSVSEMLKYDEQFSVIIKKYSTDPDTRLGRVVYGEVRFFDTKLLFKGKRINRDIAVNCDMGVLKARNFYFYDESGILIRKEEGIDYSFPNVPLNKDKIVFDFLCRAE